ncbi:AAA family ATPase [Acinetobacter baumannii]|uniref:AAA family ATPase n=1 Tax=Acinetobacter baumannii TaxID=470 RepID=UPI00123D6F64|nr:AAA family ATPase [Acinetobacter baumannii]KAA8953409.1 ATP-binding protein [Acinetobacter baumannii]QFX72149.1 AAA family ATPase [Acinetobacter baumannii]
MQIIYTEDISNNYSGIFLAKDNYDTWYPHPWDDFDYKVKFKIFYKKNEQEDEQFLGFIRILKKDIKNTFEYFKKFGTKLDEKNYDVSVLLDESIISLPLEVNFYKKIKVLFNSDENKINEFLSSIRDASYFIDDEEEFSKFNGYYDSLMREGSTSEAILKKGYQISIGRSLNNSRFKVNIELDESKFDNIILNFDIERDYGRRNINLLIGKNGSGKTYIIDQLIKTILGVDSRKIDYPYFNKVVVSAFSPFESFLTVGDLEEAYKLKNNNGEVLREKDKRRRISVNKYSYIGFRDEGNTFDKNYPKKRSVSAILNILSYDKDNLWWGEVRKKDLLKDTLSLSVEFDNIFLKNKKGDFISIDDIDEKDYSQIVKKEGIFFRKNEKIVPLSSGQEIYSYLIPTLISEIESETLLLIDEPELYLHPGLELGLIKMLKNLLEEFKSFAVIATHSSILTREVDREAVKILKREGNYTTVTLPSIQTYGADIESIISEVFEDDLESKIYEHIIDDLIEEDADLTINEVNKEFGDAGLIYFIAKNSDENIEFED